MGTVQYDLGDDVRDWKVSLAQADVHSSGPKREKTVPILYRPFDIRYCYYTGKTRGLMCMPRAEVMRHMLAGENLGLVSARSNKSADMNHFLASRYITEAKTGEATTQSCLFPLWIYSEDNGAQATLKIGPTRHPNLGEVFLNALADKLRSRRAKPYGLPKGVSPEDAFRYIYAVFHCPTYRARYREFLRREFPRVPITTSRDLFDALVGKGRQLVALHVMEDPKLDDFVSTFPKPGDGFVEHVKYTVANRRVWINGSQYFDGVDPEVWQFEIGGYRVCERWLKSRKSRTLSYDDIQHFQRVVVAVSETLKLMAGIDKLVPSWPMP